MKHSILLVFAHPDDESFGVAGTALKYSRKGIAVDLITATKGEKGTRVDVPDDIDTGTAREAELRQAAAILGIRRIYFLGYIDGELVKANLDEVGGKIVEIMRQVQPEIVITFGPDGITGHRDHITIGKAATNAFFKLQALGNGPRKLYYTTIPQSASDDEESGLATPPDEEITTVIDISSFYSAKIKAISAHRSQQDARDFLEELKNEPDTNFAKSEHFYLVNMKVTGKESDVFE